MKVIDEGKKPDPLWWGRWKCSSCGRVIELSGDELPSGHSFSPAYDIFIGQALDVRPCPTCGSDRRYDRPQKPRPPDPTFMDGVRKRRGVIVGWFRADDRRVKVALVLVAYAVGLLS